MLKAVVVLGLVSWNVACSDDGGATPAPEMVTGVQAAYQLAHVYCRRLEACEPAPFVAAYQTQQGCIDEYTSEARSSQRKGGGDRGARHDVDACARAIEARSCEQLRETGGRCD